MADKELNLILKLKDEVTAELKAMNETLKGAADAAKTATTAAASYEKQLKAVTDISKTFVVAGVAITGALGFMVKEAADADTSWNKVTQAIKNGGVSVNDALPKIKEFASSMSAVTGTTDEMIGEFVGKMIPITRDVGTAMDATRVAMDLAAGKSSDLASVQMIMSQVMSGNITMLGRYVPEIKDLTAAQLDSMTAAQRTAYALGEIEKLYPNMAAAAANQFTRMKTSLNEIGEAIGATLLPILKEVTDAVVEVSLEFNKWADKNKELLTIIVEVVGGIGLLLTFLGTTGLAIVGIIKFVGLMNTALATTKTVMLALAANPMVAWLAVLGAAIAFLGYELNKAADAAGGFGNLWAEMCLWAQTRWNEAVLAILQGLHFLTGGFGDQIGELQNKINGLYLQGAEVAQRNVDASKGVDEALKSNVTGLKTFAEAAKNYGSLSEEGFNKISDGIKEIEDKLKDLNTQMQDIIKQYNKDVLGENEDYQNQSIQMYIDATAKKKDLENDLVQARADGDINQIRDLEAKISNETQIIQSFNEISKGWDAQIAEAKQVAAMNEMQQLEFDHQKKLLQIQVESLQKQVAIAQEKKDLFDKEQYIESLLDSETKAALKADLDSKKSFMDRLNDTKAALAEWVESVKAKYAEAAQAAVSAAATISSSMGSTIKYGVSYPAYPVQDAIIAPGGKVITTDPADYLIATKTPGSLGGGGITIIVNGDISGEDLIEKVKAGIMREISFNTKFAV